MRVAVTGARGQLGSELVHAFRAAGAETVPLARPGFRLEAPVLPEGLDIVVNAAAWTDVDGCAREPDRAMVLNGEAPGLIAAAADRMSVRFLHVSTNEVFDGSEGRTYGEEDPTEPKSPYGVSKLAGEVSVRAAHPAATIVRTAWIFGGPRSFPAKILAAARKMAESGQPLRVVSDEVGNPTPAAALADRIVALAMRADAPRTIHLAGDPPISRFAWATDLLTAQGLPKPVPISAAEYRRDSTPPLHAVLDTSLARSLDLAIDWASSSTDRYHRDLPRS